MMNLSVDKKPKEDDRQCIWVNRKLEDSSET